MATVAALSANLELRTAGFTRNLDVAQRAATSSAARMQRAFTTMQAQVQRASNALSSATAGLTARLGPAGAALTALGPAGVTAAAAIGGIGLAVSKAIPAYTQFEQQTFRLNGLLKSTGNSAGLTIQQIEELAIRIGRDTLASTQGVRDAAGVLLTFKAVSGDTFIRTIELAQDLAAVMGNDLKGNVLQLAKALEDPINGLTALRRSGVSFTESQKDLIKSLVETGRVAEAQTIVLNTLAEQVGGAGTAEAGGLAGAADTAGERWKLFYERLGATAPVLAAARAVNGLNDAAASFLLGLVTADPMQEVQAAVEAVEAARNNLAAARSTPIFGDVKRAEQQLELAEQTLVAARERLQMEEVARSAEEAAAREQAEAAGRQRDIDRQAAADKERADKAREASTKVRADIDAKAAKADLAHQEAVIDFYAGVPEAIEENAKREAQARIKAAEDAADARKKAEEKAQTAIDRAREKAHQEAIRNAENLSDRLVDTSRTFLARALDDSEDFWSNFAQLGRDAFLDIAAEQLFRAPANAFAAGLFGTGGATGGANAGGIAGLAGSIGQSIASSAISDAIGLPSIGSLLGFGGGGGAAAGAFGGASATAVEAAIASGAGSGLFGGGGLLGLGAIGGPLALGGLAIGGAALLGGLGQKQSVGPNASARLVLENNRFALGPTGADNGGERFLGQAESEALAAAATLNRLIDELGLVVEDVPDRVDLATAFGDQFNRTGRNVAEDVIRSGALGDLTDEQLAAALGGESLFTAQVEAVRQALQSAGVAESMREAARIVEQAAREQEAADRQVLADQLDAARDALDGQQDLVDALDDAARTFADAVATLSAGVDQLLLSDASPLAPGARLAEAQRQFDAAVAAGDAAGAVAAGNALARENASFFGTATRAGAAGFSAITSTLRTLEADASARAAAEREALAAAEQQVAGLESAVATAEAQLAAFGEQNRISGEQLAAAQEQVDLLGQQQAALDAIEAALGEETPDTAVLRQQLDVLERVGAGQGAVALAVRDLATAITATSGGAAGANVAAIKSAASQAGVPAPDAFSAWAAEVAAMRDARFLADGGIVDRPTLAMIGEGAGPEAVIPLKGGAVPVRFEGGRGNDDMRAGIAALVEVGTETVAELRRLNGRVASLENERRHSGRQRLVGSAA